MFDLNEFLLVEVGPDKWRAACKAMLEDARRVYGRASRWQCDLAKLGPAALADLGWRLIEERKASQLPDAEEYAKQIHTMTGQRENTGIGPNSTPREVEARTRILYRKREGLRDKLAQKEVTCPACQKRVVQAKFCAECGAPLLSSVQGGSGSGQGQGGAAGSGTGPQTA